MILPCHLLLLCITSSVRRCRWLASSNDNSLDTGPRALHTATIIPACGHRVIQSTTVQQWLLAASNTGYIAFLFRASYTGNRNTRPERHKGFLIKGSNSWTRCYWVIWSLWHKGTIFSTLTNIWGYGRWLRSRQWKVCLNGTHRMKRSMRTLFTWGHSSLKLARTGWQIVRSVVCVCSAYADIWLHRTLVPLHSAEDVLQLMAVFAWDIWGESRLKKKKKMNMYIFTEIPLCRLF